jgi:FMN-dependent NADH-azoreductase
MTRLTVLHIDSSARQGLSGAEHHGSHTRRLGRRFTDRWQRLRPHDHLKHRDLATQAPGFVTAAWIAAAFTPAAQRSDESRAVLAESDALVDELCAADVIVIGAPMYNFGMPAVLKAYVDNIVRVGRTFGFDRQRPGLPYWPMLAGQGKRLVLLSARGDTGYGEGALAASNHVEPALRTVFAYIGIQDVASVAVECDEFADQRLQRSLEQAEAQVDRLVETMAQVDVAAGR